MNARPTLRRDNTSGLQGIRLNRRKGHLVLDVAWNDATGRRCCTSYLADTQPLEAVARAMHKRLVEAGALYALTPRQAWLRLKQGAQA